MNPIKAKKYLGQNFLKNTDILKRIVGENPLSNTHVIEIGPGPGDLTEAILSQAPLSLSLIEIDEDMVQLLKTRFRNKHINVYLADVLKIDVIQGKAHEPNIMVISTGKKTIALPEYDVYGNIPYYITSPIIHHFFYEVSLLPEKATFTMQREVADRILARNGKHSMLSLVCQLVAEVEKVCDINPNSFVPPPKVWSTCLRFSIRKNTSREKNKQILRIADAGFSQKRKKLTSNLQSLFPKDHVEKILRELNLSETVRAEELTLDQWKGLTEKLHP